MEAEISQGLQAALEEAEREYAELCREIPSLASNQRRDKGKKEVKAEPEKGKTTFGTAKRLERREKGEAAVVLVPSIEAIRKRVTGGVVAKTGRIATIKEEPMKLPLNPNYDVTLKKAPSAVIRTPTPRLKPNPIPPPQPSVLPAASLSIQSEPVKPTPELVEKAAEKAGSVRRSYGSKRYAEDKFEIDESQNSVSTASSEYDDFFKAKSEWDKQAKEMGKSMDMPKLHFKPAAPVVKTGLGPGAYTSNYTQVERAFSASKFPSSQRPTPKPLPPQLPLSPNYEAVKWRKPSPVIALPSDKPEALLKKRQEEAEDERFAALINLTVAAGVKDVLKPKVVGGVIPKEEEDEGKPDPEAKLGPGLYHVSYTAVEEAIPGAVRYHIPVSDLIERPLERRPGPGAYDPDDMATRPDPKEAVIGKEAKAKEPEPDMRRALHINEELVKVQAPRPHIDPEHISILPQDFSKRIGPGEYQPSYKLVEFRDSLGAVKLIPVEEKPDDIDSRVLLYPNVDFQHPNHLVFQYHQPAFVQPAHLPDKDLFPEQWKFYDVRSSLQYDRSPEFDFAQGVPQAFFLSQERDKALELRHYKRVKGYKPVPPPGAYDFEPVGERAPAYDFGKVEGREEEEIDRLENPLEGDVLLLNPVLKQHVTVLVDMKRAQGRPEDVDNKEDRDELLLDPDIAAIRPKAHILVNMDRETGRKEVEVDLDEGQGLVLDPKPVEPKVSVLVNMDKQVGRSRDQAREEDQDLFVRVGEAGGMREGLAGGEVVLEPDQNVIRKRPAVFVNMEKMTGRDDTTIKDESTYMVLPEPVELLDPTKPRVLGILPFDRLTGREEAKEESFEMRVSHPEGVPEVMKSYKSTLPEAKAVAFDRYAPRWEEEEEDLGEKRVADYS